MQIRLPSVLRLCNSLQIVGIVKNGRTHHASNMLSLATTTGPQRTSLVLLRTSNHLIRVVGRSGVDIKIKHMAMCGSVDDTNAVVRCVHAVIVVFHVLIFDILVVGVLEGWVVPCVYEVRVVRRWGWRERKGAKGGAVVVVVRIVDHASVETRTAGTVEVFAKARYAVAGEDAEDFALVVVELCRSFTAEDSQVVAEEGLNAC